MNFNKMKIAIIVLSSFFIGGLLSNGAHAVIPVSGVGGIIKNLTDMTYQGSSQWNCQGNFQPTFEYGNRCNGGICGKAIRHFKCISPGVHGCATENEVLSMKVEIMSAAEADAWRDPDGENVFISGHPNHAKYEYYRVTMYTDYDLQNVQGVVYRKKKYTVTVKSIDTNGRPLANVTGLGDITKEADGGTTATVTHGNTSAGFTFKYWAASNGANLGNGNSYNVTSSTDTVIYAVYEAYSGSSSLDIKAKKSSQSNYQDDVFYVKPTDIINFRTVYVPGAQGGHSLRPQTISVNDDGAWAIGVSLNQAFSGWSNSFRVDSKNFATNYSSMPNYVYPVGDTGTKTEYNNHTVVASEVGNEISETAQLRNDNSAKTPKALRIDLDGTGRSLAKIYTGLSDTSTVRVPYNFENDTDKPGHKGDDDPNPDDPDDPSNPGENGKGEEKVVYAGEEDSFIFKINVNPRDNPVTDGYYATVVDDARWRLGLCIGEADCKRDNFDYPSGTKTGKLNEKGLMDGQQGILQELKINIPDIKAGSKICVRAEVWPANSGAYTNWQTSGYPDSWSVSPKACYTVAKRPSTQFWGGNVYSRANLVTSTAKKVKKNLAGYSNSFSAVADDNQAIVAFGTWGELGVVGNGAISGFGSGASMGYASNANGITWPNYHPANGLGNNAAIIDDKTGGSPESKFCKRIPLTIPNSPCEEDGIGGLSSAVGITKAASDKESIVNLLASGDSTMNREYSSVKLDVNRTVVGETIDGNTTRVISADEDITIGENLEYLNGNYLSYENMPKLVIYSKKNIYIECGVTRIDALLIANDTVVTCNNIGDVTGLNNSDNNKLDKRIKSTINNPENSNQLMINGAIIAKRLIANRTYGAATGANSIVPAEIVNFDPTLYQFGGSAEANDDTTGRLDVTTMHEVAPRL